MPLRAQGGFQAHVGHGRRYHQVAGQLGLGLHIAGRHQHHAIPIHHSAVGVGEERAVGIAVEGDSQVGAQRLCFLGHHFRVQGAAVFVDVASVGGHVGQANLAAKAKERAPPRSLPRLHWRSRSQSSCRRGSAGDNVAQKGLIFLAEVLVGRGRA